MEGPNHTGHKTPQKAWSSDETRECRGCTGPSPRSPDRRPGDTTLPCGLCSDSPRDQLLRTAAGTRRAPPDGATWASETKACFLFVHHPRGPRSLLPRCVWAVATVAQVRRSSASRQSLSTDLGPKQAMCCIASARFAATPPRRERMVVRSWQRPTRQSQYKGCRPAGRNARATSPRSPNRPGQLIRRRRVSLATF